MIEMIRIARLIVDIQESATDAYDYETAITILDEFLNITENDVTEYVCNHYQEIIEWHP